MGFALVLAYIALNLLSPFELLPSLRQFRPVLILAVATVPLAVMERLRKPELDKLRMQFVLVLLFCGWALCSWFPHGWLGGNLRTLLSLTPNVIVYFTGVVVLGSPLRLRVLRVVLVVVAIFVIFNALWEFPLAKATGESTPYDLATMIYTAPSHIEVRIRGLGMLGDPNVFGQFLLMVIPMLYVAKRDTGLGFGYVIAAPVTLVFLIAVYFTGSRGAEVGVAALAGLFLIRRFRTTGAMMSAVAGGLVLLLINAYGTRAINLSGGMDRLAIWSDGMSYFKSSPVWGVGYDNFIDLQGMTAHNSYLLCAAELGFVGYFFWMSAIVVTMIQLNAVPKLVGKTNPEMARWAVAIRLSLGVYLFTAFFLSRAYQLPLFLLLGMAGAIIASVGGDEAIPLRGTGWALWTLAFCVGILSLIYVMLLMRWV
jgi:hypothetical protein